jgi:hypothetical protein
LIWTDMPMDKVGRFLVAQNVPEKWEIATIERKAQ